MHYVFQTRSFSKQPLGTMIRGCEWVVRQKLDRARTFSVQFGEDSFKMKLQSMQKRFGSAGIFVLRKYYEDLLEYGHRFINAGDCVIDGGANQGIYTCAFAAKVGPSGHVYAFEPQTYAVSCIRTNLKLNNFNNVTIFEGALWTKSGSLFLQDLAGDNAGPVAVSVSSTKNELSAGSVPAYSVGELWQENKIRDVSFIKLDIEGAELEALEGAAPMIEKTKPTICVEAISEEGFSSVKDYLVKWRYVPYVFDRNGNLNRLDGFHYSANIFYML